jgi:hypothetical protein
MWNNFSRSVLTTFFLTGTAFAQSQARAETLAVKPALETAPTEVSESPGLESTSENPNANGGGYSLKGELLNQAKASFAATFSYQCASAFNEPSIEERVPEEFELSFRYSTDSDSDPNRTMELYRFLCKKDAASADESHVYYLHYFGDVQIVAFAEPFVHVDYENEDSAGKVLGVRIIGQRARVVLDNSKLDVKTNTISSRKTWQGVGDPPSKGVWELREDSFILSTFSIDASSDLVDNPSTVIDYRAENEALSETP